MRCASLGARVDAAANASAKVRCVYAAKPGDTPESIAADYYGNRSLAAVHPRGQWARARRDAQGRARRCAIPTAYQLQGAQGRHARGLAQKFLDDKRRAPFLGGFSGLARADKLREGQELMVPFQHVHRTEAPESLQSVARTFLRRRVAVEAAEGLQLSHRADAGQGRQVLVPIAHVRIRAVRLYARVRRRRRRQAQGAPVPTLAAAPRRGAKREAELAERVASSSRSLEKAYKRGQLLRRAGGARQGADRGGSVGGAAGGDLSARRRSPTWRWGWTISR